MLLYHTKVLFKVYYIMLHFMCILFHKLLLCDFHVYFISEFREQPQFSVVKWSSLCVILVFSSCLLTKFNNLRSFEENMILLNIQKKSKADKEAAASQCSLTAVFIWFVSGAPSSSRSVGGSFCSGEQAPSEHLSQQTLPLFPQYKLESWWLLSNVCLDRPSPLILACRRQSTSCRVEYW